MTQDIETQAQRERTRKGSYRTYGARRGRRRLTPVQRIAFQVAVIAGTVGIAAVGGLLATRGDAGQANNGASVPVYRVASI